MISETLPHDRVATQGGFLCLEGCDGEGPVTASLFKLTPVTKRRAGKGIAWDFVKG